MVAAVTALGWYVVRVVGPTLNKVKGQKIASVTHSQKLYFTAAVLFLWLSSDWPMHDVSEGYLYSVHMVQHLIITFIVPPLLWKAVPVWFARLVLNGPSNLNGELPRWLKRLAHPIVAGVLFNLVVAASHIPGVVNASADNGPFHYMVHLILFSVSMVMWLPVFGPYKELRLRAPGQMMYLFAMSLLPTIPAAFLTFAEGQIYSAYDDTALIGGITAVHDQQAAGLIMKLIGGLFLWIMIAYKFFKWIGDQERNEQKAILAKSLPVKAGSPEKISLN